MPYSVEKKEKANFLNINQNYDPVKFTSTILIVPGLGNSGPAHWQSLWEQRYGFIRIAQRDWETPVCSDWISAINDEVFRHRSSSVILVGHSLASSAIAYRAQKYEVPIKVHCW